MNHWGRIFFMYDDMEKLIQVKGQPLHNHEENCRKILEKFKHNFFHEETLERLLEAVDIHDHGKTETFRIVDKNAKNKRDKKEKKTQKTGKTDTEKRFSYSFAGHRFRVPGADPYIDALIRSHHEFSVAQINREKAKLTDETDRRCFADDLYLLCMADQIEAELAVKTVENKENDAPRTFMEFVTRKVEEKVFTAIPWPFETHEFPLKFELKKLRIDDFSKLTAMNIQETFKTETSFDLETMEITLRKTNGY